MKKIVKHYVEDKDDFEIPKENIIHTRVVMDKDSSEPVLEIWCLE